MHRAFLRLAVVLVAALVVFGACSAAPAPGPPEPPAPADTAPAFAVTVADQTYPVGAAIRPLTLPAASGGNGALSYTLVPAVPGLTFTPSTRTLTGTPTTAGSYRMTYRVADADENSAASDSDLRTFTITVQVPDPPATGCSSEAGTWRGLRVCSERQREGYDRDDYGTGYRSLEDDIIAAMPATMKADGKVYTPYSCIAFDITSSGTAATDIEHIVALAEAHDSGIADDQRRDLAGDLDNLTIADPTVNLQKGARDAADWMPTHHGAWFAERVIQVKLEYGLTVDPAERDALEALLAGGGAQLNCVTESGLTSRYRGRGDQVFVLNSEGEELEEAQYTLELGAATAEVYVIATNTAGHEVAPTIARDDLGDGSAKALSAPERDGRVAEPRPEASAGVAERKWITEFNNNPPLPGTRGFSGLRAAASTRVRRGVVEGDRYDFRDRDDNQNLVSIPATARRVVTDGETTVALWVADWEWGQDCSGAGPCVTREMVDALAERFLRPGGGNDIHDWVTAIYGKPWGPHSYENILIPPEAAREIHVLLFDIQGDGAPAPGECRIVGFYWGVHNFLRNPEYPFTQISAERLIFFIDSVFMALPEGPSWEVTDRRPSVVLSTLAHEYQHMIHFYQKPILRDAGSETWLNEMASEVGEDLIADKLKVNGPRGVAYDDPTAGMAGNERGRLPYYNLFNDIQVTAWGGKIANYAVNYALGAYLARTYGGAELFSEIVQSGSAGADAIEAALAAGGHEVTFGEVLADWGAATLLSDSTAVPSRYRYNVGTWSTSHTEGGEYRLGSIDLYNYRYEPPEQVSDCIGPDLANLPAQEGPYLHTLESFNWRTQPPHSNMMATLGRNSGRVSLRITAGGDNRITVVVKE